MACGAAACAGAEKPSRGPFSGLPRLTTAPGNSWACMVRAPATYVPLVLPWSSSCQPLPLKLMVPWCQETLASSNGKSDCGLRPMV